MAQLTHDEFLVTMGEDRRALGPDDEPPIDFWPYVDAIPVSDLRGFDFATGRVSYVWATDQGRWQHVMVACDRPNVFLVIVLLVDPPRVHGHHLLDLNAHYGVDPDR